MNWEVVRSKLVEAFDETKRALLACKNEDDLLLVLDLVERYPQLARTDLRSQGPARRIEAMRAAVDAMRVTVDPIDPLKKKPPGQT